MGLQVWLPLNGDLVNQGLTDVTVTNNGATIDNNGKIGKCYSFDGNDDFISISCSDLYNTFSGGSQPFSIAFWVYHADTTRAIIFGDYGLSGAIGFNIELTTGHQVRFYWNGTPDKVFNANSSVGINTWTHIIITYDGNEICIYKNGVQQSDKYSGTLEAKSKTSGIFYLGRNYRTGATALNGKINDFRIYDHCLSPRECKQISTALVLHYPLAMPGQENLLKNSHHKCDNNGYYVGTYDFADSSKLETGKTYTLSFNGELQDDTQTGWYFNIFPSPYTAIINKPTDKEGRFAFSFVMPENGGNRASIGCYSKPLGNRLGCAIWDVKLEEGSIATPWIPAPSDALYSRMGLDDNIVYDVSGYKNNGELYATDSTGTFLYETGSPRYSIATNPHSANSTADSKTGTAYIRGDCVLVNPDRLTIAFWCYARNEGYGGATVQGVFCTTANTEDSVGSDYLYSAMNHRDSAINVNNSNADNHLRLTITFIANEWHHYAFTYDGQNARSYKDGVLFDTKSFPSPYALGSFSSVVLGFSKAGGVWRRNNNTYSDLRVYATCLDVDDILSLYNTPISLTNNGSLLTQGEIVES